MPEPMSTSPAPGTSGSPPVSGPALVQTFLAVLTRPAAFFESVKGQTGFRDPIVFAVVMGLAGGVIHAVFALAHLLPVAGAGAGLAMIVLMPIFAVIGCFVGGAIVHVVAMIAGGKGSFEHSVRIAGYSSAVLPVGALLSFIPVLQYLPSFYGLYVAALGIIALHLADRRRTFVVTGVLAAILAIFVVMAMMAASAARRAGEDLRARYGEGSEFQREMQKMSEELRKAGEEARKAAEEARKAAEKPDK
jgi:hypothetical protein